MAVFTYKATDTITGDTAGTIAADTPRQARDLLRDRGLIIRELSNIGAHSTPRAGVRFGAAPHQVTLFLTELSTLLSVGVPLLESLETLSHQHPGAFGTALLALRDRVASGSTLAAAMQQQPRFFDELCVNITEVGEDAGTLDSALERLSEFRTRSEQLRSRLGNALIYPILVTLIATAATLFLMTFVVPRILEPLVEQGLPLPLPTRIVKSFSDFVIAWWWLVATAALLAACGFAIVMRTVKGQRTIHRAILRLPLLGDLIIKQSLVRLSVVLSTLLKSGIPFVRALQIAQRSTSNVALRDALARCEQTIIAGGDIASALQQTKSFPPMVVQIFSVGQQSGKLESMLDRLAITYDQQVTTSTQRLIAILEPALIVMLALMVLVIVLATVLPILEAGNAIQ